MRKNKEKGWREKKYTSKDELEAAPNGMRQVIDAEEARRTSTEREADAPVKTERL